MSAKARIREVEPPRPPEAVLAAAREIGRLRSTQPRLADMLTRESPEPAEASLQHDWRSLTPELQALAEPLAIELAIALGTPDAWEILARKECQFVTIIAAIGLLAAAKRRAVSRR